jgi:hypothetical protein
MRRKKIRQVSLHADCYLRTFDEDCSEPGGLQGYLWDVGKAVLTAMDEDTRFYVTKEYKRDPKSRPNTGNEPAHRDELALLVWVLSMRGRHEVP